MAAKPGLVPRSSRGSRIVWLRGRSGSSFESYAVKKIKSPSAVAAHRASETDGLGRHVLSSLNRQQQFSQAPIRAVLIGSDRCEAEGIIAHGYAPVLDLCRALIKAGHDPSERCMLIVVGFSRSLFGPSAKARNSPLRIRAVRHTSGAGGTARKGMAQAYLLRKLPMGKG